MTDPGRPTRDNPEHAGLARACGVRSASAPDLAVGFGVTRSTVDQWIARHLEFAKAGEWDREIADAAGERMRHAADRAGAHPWGEAAK